MRFWNGCDCIDLLEECPHCRIPYAGRFYAGVDTSSMFHHAGESWVNALINDFILTNPPFSLLLVTYYVFVHVSVCESSACIHACMCVCLCVPVCVLSVFLLDFLNDRFAL